MQRAEQLMTRAMEVTGLSDFGDDGFREGLNRLVASVDAEAKLTAMGAAAFDMQIVDTLSNRLQVEAAYAQWPDMDAEEIVAPLIGLGLPRTGSTAFSCMLAEDPAARSIRGWEAMWPCPPPDAATVENDPRLAKAQAAMNLRAQRFPRMTSMLPSTATSPTECQTFMAMDFKTQLFQAFVHIPSYTHWLNHDADLVPTYAYVKRVLKLLQWRCGPKRWRLKNPSHILFIDALSTVFPDARYWMTHRSVDQVIPSVADLYYELHKAFSDDIDMAALGTINADYCELGMRRVIAFRDDPAHDARFFDSDFAAFQADPFAEMRRLYAFLGEDLTDEALSRMAAWRAAKPREHYERTDMACFGLNRDALRARFQFYTDRFGVGTA